MVKEKEMYKEIQFTNLDDYLMMGDDVFINSFPDMQRKDKVYIEKGLVRLHRLYLEDVYMDMQIRIKEHGLTNFLKLISN